MKWVVNAKILLIEPLVVLLRNNELLELGRFILKVEAAIELERTLFILTGGDDGCTSLARRSRTTVVSSRAMCTISVK